jgi:hypothetical protein
VRRQKVYEKASASSLSITELTSDFSGGSTTKQRDILLTPNFRTKIS